MIPPTRTIDAFISWQQERGASEYDPAEDAPALCALITRLSRGRLRLPPGARVGTPVLICIRCEFVCRLFQPSFKWALGRGAGLLPEGSPNEQTDRRGVCGRRACQFVRCSTCDARLSFHRDLGRFLRTHHTTTCCSCQLELQLTPLTARSQVRGIRGALISLLGNG